MKRSLSFCRGRALSLPATVLRRTKIYLARTWLPRAARLVQRPPQGGDDAAVRAQVAAGDGTGRLRSQETSSGGDVGRRAQAAWCLAPRPTWRSPPSPARHRRVDHAGRDEDDARPLLGPGRRAGFAHSDHFSLGREVVLSLHTEGIVVDLHVHRQSFRAIKKVGCERAGEHGVKVRRGGGGVTDHGGDQHSRGSWAEGRLDRLQQTLRGHQVDDQDRSPVGQSGRQAGGVKQRSDKTRLAEPAPAPPAEPGRQGRRRPRQPQYSPIPADRVSRPPSPRRGGLSASDR